MPHTSGDHDAPTASLLRAMHLLEMVKAILRNVVHRQNQFPISDQRYRALRRELLSVLAIRSSLPSWFIRFADHHETAEKIWKEVGDRGGYLERAREYVDVAFKPSVQLCSKLITAQSRVLPDLAATRLRAIVNNHLRTDNTVDVDARALQILTAPRGADPDRYTTLWRNTLKYFPAAAAAIEASLPPQVTYSELVDYLDTPQSRSSPERSDRSGFGYLQESLRGIKREYAQAIR